jgi:predicted anti-sigma-YlaC factor YlaD
MTRCACGYLVWPTHLKQCVKCRKAQRAVWRQKRAKWRARQRQKLAPVSDNVEARYRWSFVR